MDRPNEGSIDRLTDGGGPLAVLLSAPFGFIFAGVFGALWGSFANVCIHRLAREDARLRDVAWPPSRCPACGAGIRARDNLPVVGWLLLRGRCRDCKAPISPRYPLVELLGAALALGVYVVFVDGSPAPLPLLYVRFFATFFFALTLLVLAFIDLDTMLLPEAITLPAIPTFFVLGRFAREVPLVDAAIGGAVGFLSLKGLQLGYRAATGREGLGGGDAMLMALVGGFLGWRALPFTLGLGATLGTLISVPLLLLARRRDHHAATQHDDIATQHHDIATQQENAASQQPDAASQQQDVAAQQTPPDDAPDGTLRHAEVPFGPFLVAGALAYLFGKDAFLRWLEAWAYR